MASLEGPAALGIGVVALLLRRLRRNRRRLELFTEALHIALHLFDPGCGVLVGPCRLGELPLELADLVPSEVELLGELCYRRVGRHGGGGASGEQDECERNDDTRAHGTLSAGWAANFTEL